MRIGLPEINGLLPRRALEERLPVLVSANRFFRRGYFQRPGPALAGLDVALDSAGFVAMARYGGYRWTVEQYVELAASHPWAWWAAMDYCCEPEIAADRVTVRARMERTVASFLACRDAARVRGISDPMPVLQGWTAEDYLWSAQELERRAGPLPALVGVGSVCRRQLEGPDGLLAILAVLDAALPVHVHLHLFGVKGALLRQLPGERVASVDSMAWDFQERMRRAAAGEPSSMEKRADAMVRWVRRQT